MKHIFPTAGSFLLQAAIVLLFSAVSLFAQTSFTTFDAPGAGTGSGQGTFPVGINSSGEVAGYFFDTNFVSHGFVRAADGTITVFTPPNMSSVFVVGINNSGQVIGNGTLTVSPYSRVGFIRNADGEYTIVSIAGTSSLRIAGINNNGEVTGSYFSASNYWVSFIRESDGSITSFSDPNETTATGNGTFAYAINDSGEVAGFYNYNNLTGINQGYLRSANGNFQNFNAVVGGSLLIQPIAMNNSGEVVGYFGVNPNDSVPFVREASGTVIDFDVPDCDLAVAAGINDAGVVVGYAAVTNTVTVESFERDAAGNISTFTAPVLNYQTNAQAINASGTIAGNWVDLNFVYHGFVQ
jgi:hypothetical protein